MHTTYTHARLYTYRQSPLFTTYEFCFNPASGSHVLTTQDVLCAWLGDFLLGANLPAQLYRGRSIFICQVV